MVTIQVDRSAIEDDAYHVSDDGGDWDAEQEIPTPDVEDVVYARIAHYKSRGCVIALVVDGRSVWSGDATTRSLPYNFL